jgi:hypothetical protein
MIHKKYQSFSQFSGSAEAPFSRPGLQLSVLRPMRIPNQEVTNLQARRKAA